MPSDARTRRRLPAAEAKERILEVAQKRLTEGGPEAIRLQEVASDLGISHPTILHHFGSREGLLLALERRAMSGLQRDLLEGDRGYEAALDRIDAVLGDQGYARLLAWWVLSRQGDAAEDDRGMLRHLADAVHAGRCEAARDAGRPEPTPEDTLFQVRLLAAATFGEALLGPLLTRSAGLEDDDDVRRRFRRWLARLLDPAAD